MIEKMEINPPLFDPEASSNQQNIRRASPDHDMDASIHVDNASLIEKAMQSSQMNPQLMARARKAIWSDQLETPESFYQAAENLYDFGL